MSGFDLDDDAGESLDDQGQERSEEEIEDLAKKAPEEGEKRERREKRDRPDKKPGRSQDGDIEAFLAKVLRGIRVGDSPRNVGAAVKAAGKDYQLETLIILVPGYFQRAAKAATDTPEEPTAQARARQAAHWQTLWTEEFVESLPDALDDEEAEAAAEKTGAKRASASVKAQEAFQAKLGLVIATLIVAALACWFLWLFFIATGGSVKNDPSRAYTRDPIYRNESPIVVPQSDPMRYRNITPQDTSRKTSSDVPFDPAFGK